MPLPPFPAACRVAVCSTLAAVVLTPASALGAAPFEVAPYVQDLGPDSATIRFELSQPASAVVELTPASGSVRRFQSSAAARFHSIRVDGLQPATTSTYLVRAGSSSSERGSFTTAPSDNRPFTFTLYGDSRSDSASHAGVAREIEATPSDFLIGTGDIVDHGKNRSAWLEFFSIEGRLLRDRCLFSVIGNHELVGRSRSPWTAYFVPGGDKGPSYYSFRWSSARFFMLDSMDPWDDEQAQWLRAELAKADGEPGVQHRFVVMHQSPFSSGPHGPNRAFVRQGMVAELSKHRVDLIMAGHDHIYERGEAEGIKYLISGGAGAPLYAIGSRPPGAVAASMHHFVQVHVDGAAVDVAVHALGKGVFERASYVVGQPWMQQAPGPALAASAAPSASASSAPPASPSVAPPQVQKSSRCSCSLVGGQRCGPWAALLAAAAVFAGALRRRNLGA